MKRALKLLLAASGLNLLAAGLFGPIYAVFVEEIGGDLLTAGTAYSLFAFSAGILIFLLSKWEDHVKHKEKLVIGGYALSSVGFLGYLFISKPIHLFMVQLVLGIGEAISAPAWDGMYSKNLSKKKFTSEWGAWESMNWIVAAIAAAGGGFLANLYGFRVLFGVMFALSIASLIATTFLIKRNR